MVTYMIFCGDLVPIDRVLYLPPDATYGNEWIVVDAETKKDAISQWEHRGESVWELPNHRWGFAGRGNKQPPTGDDTEGTV